MQIPDFNLFWTIAGAFVAAGLTWLFDFVWVKRKTVESADDSRLAALQEKARMVEPLRTQLDHAQAKVAELEGRIAALPEPGTTSHVDVTPYQNRIDELLAQLGEAQHEKQGLLEEVQQIKTIAGQAHEQGQAVEQLRAELALMQGEAAERVAMISQLKNENDALRHGAASLTPELEDLKAKLQQAEAESNLLKEKNAEWERQSALAVSVSDYQQLQTRFSALQTELESLSQQPATPDLTDTVVMLREQLALAQTESENARRALSELREQRVSAIDTTDQQIADLEAELAEARAQLEERAQQLQSAHAELRAAAAAGEGPTVEPEFVEQIRQQLEAANARAAQAEELQAALEAKAREALLEVDQLKAAAASAPAVDLGSLTAEAEKWQSAYESAQAEVERLRSQLTSASERAATAASASDEVQKLRNELEAAEDKVFEALREASELREQLSSIDEIRAESEQLRAKLPALEEIVHERDDLAAKLQQAQAELEEKEEALALAQNVAESHQATEDLAEALKVELEDKDAELQQLSRRLPELDQLVNELREELGEKASRIEKLEAVAGTVEAVDNEAAELRAMVQQLSAELEQSKRESQEIRTVLVKVQAEAELLRESASELELMRGENLRLKNFVESNEAAKSDIAPLRTRVTELFAALGDANKENEGNRKALQATLEELRKLRHDVSEINRLREENAKLRSQRQPDPKVVQELEDKLGEAASAVERTQRDTQLSNEDLSLANNEISRLRQEMARSSELGELS